MKSRDGRKIVLHAGEYCFAHSGKWIHTLLGSCISITMWHPQRHIGGMCHFALPRPAPREPGARLDPRYAEDCIDLFRQSTVRTGTSLRDYQVKIFGGGNMSKRQADVEPDALEKLAIGDRNAAAAFTLLMQENVDIEVAHVGEFGYRRIVFDLSTGTVWVRFTATSEAAGNTRTLDGVH